MQTCTKLQHIHRDLRRVTSHAGRGRQMRALPAPEPTQRITAHPHSAPLHKIRTDDMLPLQLLTPHQARVSAPHPYLRLQVMSRGCYHSSHTDELRIDGNCTHDTLPLSCSYRTRRMPQPSFHTPFALHRRLLTPPAAHNNVARASAVNCA